MKRIYWALLIFAALVVVVAAQKVTELTSHVPPARPVLTAESEAKVVADVERKMKDLDERADAEADTHANEYRPDGWWVTFSPPRRFDSLALQKLYHMYLESARLIVKPMRDDNDDMQILMIAMDLSEYLEGLKSSFSEAKLAHVICVSAADAADQTIAESGCNHPAHWHLNR